ncbi:MAG TPA: S8 family serine peptidase [Candidatus Aphodovivens avistercoris]|nr:S8 family serine peptidase [Candidatus Aphodovivens avistercoris]
MVKRVSAFALSVILAAGLLPLSAFAEEPAAEETQWEPGTYVEHEAIAYVVDDGSQARAFSLGGDLLDGAETLVTVDAEAAAEALGDDAEAGGGAEPAAHARTLALDGASDEPAGRLVLVRDESKTTEELIAELEADERVLFAEPNGYVESFDEEPEGFSGIGEGASSAGLATGDGAGALEGETSNDAALSQGEKTGDSSDDPSESEDPAAGSEPVTFGSDDEEPAADMTEFQWGMSNDGAMGGVSADEAVDIDYDVWNDAVAAGGLDDVVVAVIDSGVDETNPDLAGVLWDEGEEYSELTVLGGDAHGFSTVSDTTSTSPISVDQSHGTHVAGIIAAEWNDEGVSGVAPNVEIMSVRSEVDAASDMLRCINYVTEAAKAGVNVRVANCSWGMGSNASRAFDVAFTQMGKAGVMAVFASGNSDSDMDATLNTISTLRDNPYVVVTDSIDASGELSMFSCYGQATTDVVAPGSTILSTWPTSDPQYLGEEDDAAALYESFDSKTRVADGVLDEGSPVAGGNAVLSFRYPSGESASVVPDEKRFDGDASLELSYNAEEAISLGADGLMAVRSNELDLSDLPEKPRYLSIRMTSECANGGSGYPQVMVSVNTTDGSQSAPLSVVSEFGIGGDSWTGYFVELPENTDFENFGITILYLNLQISVLGGQRPAQVADGTIYIDSIGLGSDLVPYKYSQGTSMAAPAVTGAAAVIAGMHSEDSAAQLAAYVKGAAAGDAYEESCSTGGYATVDGAANPSPVPVEAELAEDGATATVRGYFVPDDVQVSIGGTSCAVVSRDSAVGGSGDSELTELTVQAPEGFAGGEAWVELAGSNGSGRMLVQFETIAQEEPTEPHVAYYDEMNLPVPEELNDWGGWQLVGFAGDVYALPQENEMNYNAEHSFMMKYDPQLREWSRVATPSSEQLAATGVRNVTSMTGATYQGSLIVQITSNAYTEGSEFYTAGSFWRYTVEGTWEHISVPSLDGVALSLSALGSDGESLYVFGGKGSYGYPDASGAAGGEVKTIFRVDLETGAAVEVGEMVRERHNAQVAYRDGVFLVGGGQNTSAQEASSMGVERFRVLSEAETLPSPTTGEMTEYPAGSLVNGAVRMSSLVTETGELAFAPAAVADGFMIVGARCDEDKGVADTYTVSSEDGALPQVYGKLASSQRLLAPSALAYEGKLYVLAATTSAPYRVFSATAVETVAQPGDYVAPQDGDAGDQGGSLKQLASTGDPLGPLAVGAVIAAAAGGACLIRSRVLEGRV